MGFSLFPRTTESFLSPFRESHCSRELCVRVCARAFKRFTMPEYPCPPRAQRSPPHRPLPPGSFFRASECNGKTVAVFVEAQKRERDRGKQGERERGEYQFSSHVKILHRFGHYRDDRHKVSTGVTEQLPQNSAAPRVQQWYCLWNINPFSRPPHIRGVSTVAIISWVLKTHIQTSSLHQIIERIDIKSNIIPYFLATIFEWCLWGLIRMKLVTQPTRWHL